MPVIGFLVGIVGRFLIWLSFEIGKGLFLRPLTKLDKMKIEHLAIWVKDLENMRSFYEKYSPNIQYNKKGGLFYAQNQFFASFLVS